MAKKPTITALRIQSGTERTAYCTWNWAESHTDHYHVVWYYGTGDGISFVGGTTDTTAKQATYTAPDNAAQISVKVRPISTKHTVNKKSVNWWTADFSTLRSLNIAAINITTPTSGPDVSISSSLYLSAEATGLNGVETQAVFRIYQYKSNKWQVLKDITANVNRREGTAAIRYKVASGYPYKVYVRGKRGKFYGAWSPESDTVRPIPAAPKSFLKVGTYALTAESFRLQWTPSPTAESYVVEYATSPGYFNRSPSEVRSVTITDGCVAIITGLDTGRKWYFRVKAVNNAGSSAWHGGGVKNYVLLGAAPTAPTTWSEASSAVVGESVNLHFVHNTQDESQMTSYQINIRKGDTITTETVSASGFSGYYTASTAGMSDQDVFLWRVRTAGVTREYSPYSVARSVKIYEAPTLSLLLEDSAGESVDSLTAFPLVVSAEASPTSQIAMGYDLRIVANEEYTTTDEMGNEITIPEGSTVYQRYISAIDGADLHVELSAGDVALENNVQYTAVCVVAMSSGMSASAERSFTVAWADDVFLPDAQIAVDMETLAASVNPYCVDENGDLVENVVLSVYRREYDGTFTEIASEVENSDSIFVTDPHPALDFARYRIVAMSTTTGQVAFSDIPGVPVGVTDVVVQWDEAWQAFDTTSEDALEETTWSGSVLRLPYNIDVSDNIKKDTSMVYYAGRENPVSYYGDGIQTENTWKVDVDRSDSDTIYALRRLARYAGDVYVREPSGIGYWANVEVSMGQQHLELIVPVTMAVTKVEGGM